MLDQPICDTCRAALAVTQGQCSECRNLDLAANAETVECDECGDLVRRAVNAAGAPLCDECASREDALIECHLSRMEALDHDEAWRADYV